MSAKYSNTTSDYLEWDVMLNLVRKLENDDKKNIKKNDRDYKMSLYISISSFFGLRISDILKLTWSQILNVDEFTIIEKKTKKKRTIRINQQLQKHILNCYNNIKPNSIDEHILISQKGTVFSIQQINHILKQIKEKYKLNVKNFSSHSLRKCWARAIYNANSENAELALIKLSEMMNHHSVKTTRIYIGLRHEELLDTYDQLSF